MTGRASENRVCPASGTRPVRAVYWTGKVRCPTCGRMVYTTVRDGKLYRHERLATR